MEKNHRGRWVISAITILCIGMICFFSTLKQNAEVRIYPKQAAASFEAEEAISEDQNTITIYSSPYYGMSEADLNHCLLGKPMIVSECSSFDKKAPKDRIRYYYFGYGSGKNSGKIIVRYRKYNDQDDEYVDLPSDNGYVDSGYYVDRDGVEYQLDSYGVTKMEEETESTTEETKKKSGGRILPGSRDSGNGSSAGSYKSEKSSSATTELDPDNHDIEAYYEDNIDEFDSIDDAYDAFEDDEDAWDY